MPDQRSPSFDAVTTPAGIAGVCASCGATVADATTSCPKCGTAIEPPTPEHSDTMRARLQEAVGNAYGLLELLGRGGMGIVFRAREVALDREVALKVLALDPILAPDAYTRFEREARLAARLDHPHIVPIFAVGQRQSVAFYTMRLVRGGSLEELIASGRQLDLEHAVKLLREVAAALDHAHRQGVVHRDIKPANVLLGETGHAMVADFGIAKALSASEAGTTGTGIIGSPGYMSPEQWRGEEIDGRADQYSLGVVAYELLTGKRPFESPRVQELLLMHLQSEVPPLSRARPGLPDSVDAALRRALAKDPSQRFSSVTAFVDALAGLRSATIGTQTQRGPRYERRAPAPTAPRRGVGSALLALLLACVAGGAFVLPQTRDPIMDALQPMVRAAEEMSGVQQDPAAPADSLLAHPGPPADSGAHPAVAMDGVATDTTGVSALGAPPAPDPEVVRSPYGVADPGVQLETADTTLAEHPVTRPRSRMQYGWIRVVINGGSAPVTIDGLRYGSTPVVARAEVGQHLVRVLGGGDAFLPSQIGVSVTANDTLTAMFSTPEALQRAERARQQRDSTARALPPAQEADVLRDTTATPPRG